MPPPLFSKTSGGIVWPMAYLQTWQVQHVAYFDGDNIDGRDIELSVLNFDIEP